MSSNPLISVVVPVYNAAPFLEQTLRCLLAQGAEEIEVITVNDGSTDSSGDICRALAAEEDRLIVIEQPNRGVSAARNAALDRARGEWVAFCDADDLYLPGALMTLLEAARAVNADWALGLSLTRSVDGRERPTYPLQERVVEGIPQPMPHLALWGYLLKRSTIERYGIRFEPGLAFSEDSIFMLSYALRAKRLAQTTAPVYIYRLHPTSACQAVAAIDKAHHLVRAAGRIRTLSGEAPEASRATIERTAGEIEHAAIEGIAYAGITPKRMERLRRDLVVSGSQLARTPLRYYVVYLKSTLRRLLKPLRRH